MDAIDFFKFPDEWDIAKSKKTPEALAVWFDNHLSRLGVKTKLFNLGSFYFVTFSGAKIEFRETDYGCEIKVTITDKNQDDDLIRFFALWKDLADKDHPPIWGGHYRKDILKSQKKWCLFEHLPPDLPKEKLRMLELWCQGKGCREIKGVLSKEFGIVWKASTINTYISDLRIKHKEAKIPNDKERKRLDFH